MDEWYGDAIPDWLEIVPPTEDIASLFNQANCYISASLKETMSMGIAEASLFGLPVIQSDIPGTWWNACTPSAFLFRVNDANELAKRMRQVMEMPKDTMRALCAKSQAINKARLSIGRWSDTMIEIFENL